MFLDPQLSLTSLDLASTIAGLHGRLLVIGLFSKTRDRIDQRVRLAPRCPTSAASPFLGTLNALAYKLSNIYQHTELSDPSPLAKLMEAVKTSKGGVTMRHPSMIHLWNGSAVADHLEDNNSRLAGVQRPSFID